MFYFLIYLFMVIPIIIKYDLHYLLKKRYKYSLMLSDLTHLFYPIDPLRTEKVKISYHYDILQSVCTFKKK